MPIKLISPRPGKTPYYGGRGKHLGVYVDRSTKARDRALARKIIKKWEREIEAGQFAIPGEPTFSSAAIGYMNAGGERRPLAPLLKYFQSKPLKQIDQAAIDAAAAALMPNATAATRNREIYTPVSAVLKHAGFDFKIKRPKGWRGRIIRRWLWPEQAWRVIDGAYRIDAELGILCVMLLFGGLRISEQLAMVCDDVQLREAFAFVPDSKNGEPQPVHLTPTMIKALEAHPRSLKRPGGRLFRFHKGGGLDFMLIRACAIASGIEPPRRVKRGSKWPKLPPYEFDWVTWHTFRRTYATWMRRYGDLDDKDLVDTHRWKTIESASRYAQTVVHEAARRADLLPIPPKLPNAKLGASAADCAAASAVDGT
jgi:integrase